MSRDVLIPTLRRRAATYLLVFVAALSLNFLLPRVIPGNPVEELSSGPISLDPRTLRSLQEYYGLDRPLAMQFVDYFKKLGRGDLGTSIAYRAPVAHLLLERLPWTFFLTVSALVLSFSAALPLGALRLGENEKDWWVLVPAVFLESVPPFVLGSVLLITLSVRVPLFPLGGAYDAFSALTGAGKVLDLLHHAALPVVALAASSFFPAYLVVRSSVRMAAREPYVLMAEMKGLPGRTIRLRYILRTALLPVVAFFGLRLATSAGVAILVEVLFAYPGIGRLTYEAVLSHDYALLQGTFLVFTLWVILVNLCTDCLTVALDPRIREV